MNNMFKFVGNTNNLAPTSMELHFISTFPFLEGIEVILNYSTIIGRLDFPVQETVVSK